MYGKWGFPADYPRGAEIFKKLFEKEPIEYNRVGPFQHAMMYQFVTAMLPNDGKETYVKGQIQAHCAAAAWRYGVPLLLQPPQRWRGGGGAGAEGA